jgi:hypothetical protein
MNFGTPSIPGLSFKKPAQETLNSIKLKKKDIKETEVKVGEPQTQEKPPANQPTPAISAEKQLKVLKKKLRQIDEISDKKQQGIELNQEQLEKLARREQLQDQLQDLESQLTSLTLK